MEKEVKKVNLNLLKVGRLFGILTLLSIFGIPTGLIWWLFDPIGWKIALSALIALPFLIFMLKSVEYVIKKEKE